MDGNYTDANALKGWLAREAFIKVLQAQPKYKDAHFAPTRGKLDTIYHIDLLVFLPDGTIESYDVKDNMAFDRQDRQCFPAERKNVSGNTGSLYGRQQMFALQEKDFDNTFYIINRKAVADFVDRIVNDETEFVNELCDAVYKRYQRKHQGKKDDVTLILLDDLYSEKLVIQIYKDND